MANPKRRHSKARTATRRAQYKVTQTPALQECDNCGATKMLHRACPACGHYRGRSVVERDHAWQKAGHFPAPRQLDCRGASRVYGGGS